MVYSGANLQATVTGLSPATLYFFSLVAYNAGGSTQSSPDGVPFPNVTIINATALAIVWSTPLVPNGIVTGYVVLQTNIPSGFSYVSTDLQPFTAHSCSYLACTVRGCGSSTPTLAITAETPPPPPPPPQVGYMYMSIAVPSGLVLHRIREYHNRRSRHVVHVCVCMCVLCACVHVCVYVIVRVYVCVCDCVCVCMCVSLTMYTCTCMYMYVCVMSLCAISLCDVILFPLLPPELDGFDAVSVPNVGSTYIIVSWDLPTHSNGILINFSLDCNGALAGVLSLTVISYNTTGLLPFTFYMYMYVFSATVCNMRK